MNKFKFGAMVFCLALVVLAFSAGANADEWNKITVVTFSAPVEIPGVGAQVLPAGTYVFKLLDHRSDRNIVQILNESRDHVYSTILAIPNYRLQSTEKTVMTFKEEPPANRKPSGLGFILQTIGARNLYIQRQGLLNWPS